MTDNFYQSKMWSINVFAKDENGQFSKDLYGPKYRWSYESYQEAKNSFDMIPISDNGETLCELIESSFNTKELVKKEEKLSTLFASNYIFPGKYQDEIGKED